MQPVTGHDHTLIPLGASCMRPCSLTFFMRFFRICLRAHLHVRSPQAASFPSLYPIQMAHEGEQLKQGMPIMAARTVGKDVQEWKGHETGDKKSQRKLVLNAAALKARWWACLSLTTLRPTPGSKTGSQCGMPMVTTWPIRNPSARREDPA